MRPLNVLTVGSGTFLRVVCREGSRVHLTHGPELDPPGIGEHHPGYWRAAWTHEAAKYDADFSAYDQAAGAEERWTPDTLCRREWSSMATEVDERYLRENEVGWGGVTALPEPRERGDADGHWC